MDRQHGRTQRRPDRSHPPPCGLGAAKLVATAIPAARMRKRCTAQKNVKKECKFTRMGDTALSTCARKFIPAAVTVHKDRREGQSIGLLQQVPTTSLRGLYKATFGWLFFLRLNLGRAAIQFSESRGLATCTGAVDGSSSHGVVQCCVDALGCVGAVQCPVTHTIAPEGIACANGIHHTDAGHVLLGRVAVHLKPRAFSVASALPEMPSWAW